MRFRSIVLSYLLLAPMVCLAQTQPKAELFGGFSRAGRKAPVFNGWNGSMAVNIFKSMDLVADFAGYYNSGQYSAGTYSSTWTNRRYAFLFGPRFSYRGRERWTPFAHVLIGLERDSRKGSDTSGSYSFTYENASNAFCTAVGAGLDIKVKRGIAVRVIQFDGMGLEQGGFWGFDYRFSTGLVIQLSSKH